MHIFIIFIRNIKNLRLDVIICIHKRKRMIMFYTLFHDILKRRREITCGEFESDRCRFRCRKIFRCKSNRTRSVFARKFYQCAHWNYK
ncbi:hypothetical protein AR158_c770R [Paramecium bursaria Chlorella virus AR158]|uniref:hypothetical protein n=1 Tax=Paramecium bursaria Chlorella virus AR158 TaxID=380598 RepID=UPI00015AA8CF|nr:hypothetical protein AR158_c770R [Paramecium bursaria Chlorella virus AR158]ABU44315.1 hypothetical protein AR158_c770R [Paramecium bursaria Chlorella virus AR158]